MTRNHSEQEEATLADTQVNILLSIGGLFHIDHLLKLGWPKTLYLFDPAWAEEGVLEQELELLAGLAKIKKQEVKKETKKGSQSKEKKEVTVVHCVSEKGKHKFIFYPIIFDGSFVDEANVIHGPHLLHEDGWPDVYFNETVRKEIKERAKEDAVLFNI